jgi:hypothetical protein
MQDHPITQLYRSGELTLLGEALGDPRHALRFRRASSELRRVALDPRLTFALIGVNELQ